MDFPITQKPPKQFWTSERTILITKQRNDAMRAVRRKGRALKALVTDPEAALARWAIGTKGSCLQFVAATVEAIQEDKTTWEAMLGHLQAAVTASVKEDRVHYATTTSQKIAKAAECGLNMHLHRAIRPIKTKRSKNVLMLKDSEGRQTLDREDEGTAVKQYLAERGRGELLPYADLISRARDRVRDIGYSEPSCEAVVGILDTRKRAKTAKSGKTHGPSAAPADTFRAAAPELARLHDPTAVEATLSASVPLMWQGGNNAMLLPNSMFLLFGNSSTAPGQVDQGRDFNDGYGGSRLPGPKLANKTIFGSSRP